jgi:hypothetical protein
MSQYDRPKRIESEADLLGAEILEAAGSAYADLEDCRESLQRIADYEAPIHFEGMVNVLKSIARQCLERITPK